MIPPTNLCTHDTLSQVYQLCSGHSIMEDDNLLLVTQNALRLFKTHMTTQPQPNIEVTPLKDRMQRAVTLTYDDGRKFRILVYTMTGKDSIDAEIIMTTKVEQRSLGESVVKFPLPLYKNAKTRELHDYFMQKSDQKKQPPPGYSDLIAGIKDLYLPTVTFLELFKDWMHTISVEVTEESQYKMNIECEKNIGLFFLYNPRYITITYTNQKIQTIQFTTGKNGLAKNINVGLYELKLRISNYLNENKWTKFSAQYEAQYKRLVDLIDRPTPCGFNRSIQPGNRLEAGQSFRL